MSTMENTPGSAYASAIDVELYRYVQGTFHQGSDIFSNTSRGRQCVANALVSCVVRHVSSKPLVDWTGEDIDNILLKGDVLYQHTLRFYDSVYLEPCEIPSYTCFEGQKVRCTVTATYSGDIGMSFKDCGNFYSLESALSLCLGGISHKGIIVCSNSAVAVHYCEPYFHVFDSHSRDAEGKTSDEGEVHGERDGQFGRASFVNVKMYVHRKEYKTLDCHQTDQKKRLIIRQNETEEPDEESVEGNTRGQNDDVHVVSRSRSWKKQQDDQQDQMAYCHFMAFDVVIKIPYYWKNFSPGRPVKQLYEMSPEVLNHKRHFKVNIERISKEFKAIEKLTKRTWEQGKVGMGKDARNLDKLEYTGLTITKIQRIENAKLYDDFYEQKKKIFKDLLQNRLSSYPRIRKIPGCTCPVATKKCGAVLRQDFHSQINEYLFFHGTRADVDTICNQGLDFRLGRRDAMFGFGIYGAESSTKADQYADDKEKRSRKDKHMFLVRFVLGRVFLCKDDNPWRYCRPPCTRPSCLKDICPHTERFDSLVADNGKLFREFVIYKSEQCYPAYLITYNRD